MLLVYSNCIWLVWDLDIYMEECWSAANTTLTSTMLLSSCISFLSTGVFFMDSTVLVWDLDTCEEEEELEECWSAVPYPMISAAMMGFHFHSAALSKSNPLSFSSVHRAAPCEEVVLAVVLVDGPVQVPCIPEAPLRAEEAALDVLLDTGWALELGCVAATRGPAEPAFH